MAEKELGPDFAIHGGGIDLVFPHHENEIAQTEAARGVPLAEIWMHNGMVQIDEEKMSKSDGNIFQLSEAIDRYGGEAVVAYLASGHYRQPLAFSRRAAHRGRRPRVERIRNYLRDAPGGASRTRSSPSRARPSSRRWPTTSTPRGRSPRCSSSSPRATAASCPGPAASLEELLPLLGLGSLLAGGGGAPTPRPRRCSPSARRPAPRRTSSAPTRSATSSPSSAGRFATRPAAPASSGAAERWPTRELIYGRRPVAEAERGRRKVHRVWRGAGDTGRSELERLCGSPDHQGVVAEVDPYPYADPDGLLDGDDGQGWSSRSTRSRTRTTSAPSAARPRSPGRRGS